MPVKSPLQKAQKTAAPPVPPADVLAPAADAGMTPLEYMLTVMRDADQDPARRDRMAMAAAPFVHIRPADAKPGKKDIQAETAKQAAGGKFKPAAPPLKLVGR